MLGDAGSTPKDDWRNALEYYYPSAYHQGYTAISSLTVPQSGLTNNNNNMGRPFIETTASYTGNKSTTVQNSAASEAVLRTIYVANIDVKMSSEQLALLFGTCGTIIAMRLCGDTSEHNTRFAFIEFSDIEAAEKALEFNLLQVGSHNIKVARAKNPINKAQNTLNYNRNTHGSVNANLSAHSLPIDKQDAITRTVYVGSIDVNITAQQLIEFFVSYCGPANKSRLAGDSFHDTRFAFIEFSTAQGAQKAIQLSGTTLGNFNIKVSMAKAPILNDSAVVHHQLQPNFTMLAPKIEPVQESTSPYLQQLATQFSWTRERNIWGPPTLFV